ncbi:glycosyltransferase family protein [Nodularia spumigena]|uniref:Glycosyl transferase family 1 domain-containing protein n=1 Tax=Nodularia spumigena UHCC 0060 TaxID=3110300 RepID=A0ABU5UZ67_NODSP|nr:hypothetical protein [Nodularia spumigena]MEA5526337.1 hypothetical protein [Nodularia spumigena UHCC 0143]MEA5611103.1 hypothetical protein [Nodularia spumigena UHCC 0060]MEA5612885.1 hypothetical protein [Nodularia spumigena UHCC 0040]
MVRKSVNCQYKRSRYVETSFPSKLPEYAQFGKPIVIWGPEYCSAIHWGRKGDRALCVTDENPNALISALKKIQHSPQIRRYYAQKTMIAAQTEFNPHLIQIKFLELLKI